jgi:putative toxin-antitoxin system antitoxin component (TIGR02293 family)
MSTQSTALASARKAVPAAAPEAATAKGAHGRGGRARATAEPVVEHQARLYSLSRSYLGGAKYWRHRPASRSDVHAAIVGGVPYGSLVFLVSQVKGLEEADVAKMLGVSTRTLRRQGETPDKPMPADLASKAWLFAETLAKATEIFGGKEEAERWMSRPATGLDGQRPIELLQTVQGAELVTDFLTRLEYGVYS